MGIDRRAFFDGVRGALYGGRLARGQVGGMTALLDRFERGGETDDLRFLAYMLATAHHETGGRMRPVRETFAATDEAAIARLDRPLPKGCCRRFPRPIGGGTRTGGAGSGAGWCRSPIGGITSGFRR